MNDFRNAWPAVIIFVKIHELFIENYHIELKSVSVSTMQMREKVIFKCFCL